MFEAMLLLTYILKYLNVFVTLSDYNFLIQISIFGQSHKKQKVSKSSPVNWIHFCLKLIPNANDEIVYNKI